MTTSTFFVSYNLQGFVFDMLVSMTLFGLFRFLKKNIFRYKVETVRDTEYFEGHFKVMGVNTIEEWRKLAKICRNCEWSDFKVAVPLLANYYSKKGCYPTTTFRMYDTDMYTFLVEFNKFRTFMEKLGYVIEHPHVESSYDDDDPLTDLNWAIFENEKNSLEKYKNGAKFLDCFRWALPSDITDEACEPPADWLEKITAFESKNS